jgi:hypothetical protein
MLRVPNRALLLIEAKFGSPNGTLKGHEDRFESIPEFLNRYPGMVGGPDPLNREWLEAQSNEGVLQQLLRNIIFAQWLAADGEEPWVVNLVRESEERDVEQQIAFQLSASGPVRFRRCAWEELFRLPALTRDDAAPLRTYAENKTSGLAKAFHF